MKRVGSAISGVAASAPYCRLRSKTLAFLWCLISEWRALLHRMRIQWVEPLIKRHADFDCGTH